MWRWWIGRETAHTGRGGADGFQESGPELVHDTGFDDGYEGRSEGHAAFHFLGERADGGFTDADNVVGVADFQATFTDSEETDYFGFVAILVLVVGLVGYGEGDADYGFVGRGGHGQWEAPC